MGWSNYELRMKGVSPRLKILENVDELLARVTCVFAKEE